MSGAKTKTRDGMCVCVCVYEYRGFVYLLMFITFISLFRVVHFWSDGVVPSFFFLGG